MGRPQSCRLPNDLVLYRGLRGGICDFSGEAGGHSAGDLFDNYWWDLFFGAGEFPDDFVRYRGLRLGIYGFPW